MLLNQHKLNYELQCGILIVTAHFERPSILITMPGGTMADPLNQIGLAHFCEHVLVHMLLEQVKNSIIEDSFDYVAYTDYSHIVLHLSVKDEPSYFQLLIEALHITLSNRNITSGMIKRSRQEILREINVRKHELQQLADSYQSVINGNEMPLLTGESQSVKNITKLDVANYINSLYKNTNISLFYNADMHKNINVALLNYQNDFSENLQRATLNGMSLIYSKQNRYISIQIIESVLTDQAHKLFQMIHELIIIDLIVMSDLNLDCIFSQKSFTQFQYIRMAKIDKNELKCIDCLLEKPSLPIEYSKLNFEKHRMVIHQLLNESLDNVQIDTCFVTDTVLRNMKYGDLLILSNEDIREIDKVLECLTYENFKEFCKVHYPTEMKVIKT